MLFTSLEIQFDLERLRRHLNENSDEAVEQAINYCEDFLILAKEYKQLEKEKLALKNCLSLILMRGKSKMTNPIIQTDLAEILGQINQKLDKLSTDVTDLKIGQTKLEGKIEAVDEKLSGKIEAVDEKLSGKIEAVDEKLSGKINALDTKVEQLDKRIGNSELTNRGILIGLVVIILGGAAKLFGFIGS